jgi:hypothetical protein
MSAYIDSIQKQKLDALKKAHVDAAYADAAAVRGQYRKDSSTGLYAQHLVIATHRQVFAHRYPELVWADNGLNMDMSMNPGAQTHSWQEVEQTGEAKFLTSEATDFPIAEINGQVNFGNIQSFGIAVRYTIEDVETAAFQNTIQLVPTKVAAAKRGHDLTLNNLIRSGDAAAGYQGITNLSGIQIATATNGDWTNVATTANDIIQDVTDAINAYIDDSNGILQPTHIRLPQIQWSILSTTRITDGVGGDTGTVVLEFLRKAFPMIQMWGVDTGLSTAGAGGVPTMLIYRDDPADVTAVMPLRMQPLPVETRGMEFVLRFRSRWGGLRAPQPHSIKRVDGI